MANTEQPELLLRRCTDERGRLIPLTPEQREARKAAALAALDDLWAMDFSEEDRETFKAVAEALERNRSRSDRPDHP